PAFRRRSRCRRYGALSRVAPAARVDGPTRARHSGIAVARKARAAAGTPAQAQSDRIMRILLAQNSLYYPAHGGGDKSNRLLLEALRELGHDCRVVARISVFGEQ